MRRERRGNAKGGRTIPPWVWLLVAFGVLAAGGVIVAGLGLVLLVTKTKAPPPQPPTTVAQQPDPDRPPALQNAPSPQPTIVITDDDLIAAYRASDVAADATYRQKTIRVRGVVCRAVKGKNGKRPYAMLGPGDGPEHWTVLCHSEPVHDGELARLNLGDKVEIVGRCAGRTARSVVLEECRVVGR